MKKILVLIFFISIYAKAFDFKIATMNIRFYGKGGEVSGELKDEFRDQWISEFIKKELPYYDGILFQEIVDKERFYKMMDRLYMNCYSYESKAYLHQHVVLCLNKKYVLETIPSLNSFAYWPVADVYRGKLRPALVGIVKERNTKKGLLTIAGLHLKARETHSQTRMDQIGALAQLIAKSSKLPPFVVLGDFNTHSAQDTNRRTSDLTMTKTILDDVDMSWSEYKEQNTFKLPDVEFQFDHIFISSKLRSYGTKVNGPCNNDDRGDRFEDYFFYNRFVSDHCPVSTTLVGQ